LAACRNLVQAAGKFIPNVFAQLWENIKHYPRS